MDLRRAVLRYFSHEAEEHHAQVSCPTEEENDGEFLWFHLKGLKKEESQLCLSVVDGLVSMVSRVSGKALKGKEFKFVNTFVRKVFVYYYKIVEIN